MSQKYIMISLYILTIGLLGNTIVYSQDPCTEYRDLNDAAKRRTGYLSQAASRDNQLCDRNLDEGWYRATSKYGGDMATIVPPFRNCGTLYPVWFKGNLPESIGEETQGTACVVGIMSTCANPTSVRVRNCGSFNVYYLYPTSTCPEAYCFGREPQPTSPQQHPQTTTTTTTTPPQPTTHYTTTIPNAKPTSTQKGPSLVIGDPKLDLTIESSSSSASPVVGVEEIISKCSLTGSTLEASTPVTVTFYIGDTLVKKEDMTVGDLPGELTGSEMAQQQEVHKNGYFGHDRKLRCQISVQTDSSGRQTVQTEKHVGFKIKTEKKLYMGDDESRQIVVELNVPVLCDVTHPNCSVDVDLILPPIQNDYRMCVQDDGQASRVVGHQCTLSFKASRTSQTQTVVVQGVVQDTYVKDSKVDVRLRSAPSTMSNTKFLTRYKLEPVEVTVSDSKRRIAGMICSARTINPHMTLFSDARYQQSHAWEGHAIGEFILYTNQLQNTEVQIKTSDCVEHKAACICAVMIRSGSSGFVLDTCGPRSSSYVNGRKYEPRVKMFRCSDKEEMIIENPSKNEYVVTFPSKTRVKVSYRRWQDWHDVYVIPSPSDYQQSGGLCGYIHKPGSSQLRLRKGYNTQIAETFMKDWEVRPTERLFDEPKLDWSPLKLVCPCSDKPCRVMPSENECINRDYGTMEWHICQDRIMSNNIRRLRPDTVYDEGPFIDMESNRKLTKVASWMNGWTEEKAREYCQKYIYERQSVKACRAQITIDVDEAVRTCILDIKSLGSPTASASHVEAVITSCLTELYRDTTLWTSSSSNDGTVIPPSSVTDTICPSECNNQGACVKGECRCDSGYSGSDCSVMISDPPRIVRLPLDGLCDLQTHTCRSTAVYVDLADISDQIQCRVSHSILLSSGGVRFEKTTLIDAEWSDANSVVCKLGSPSTEKGVLADMYAIELSYDAAHFGDTQIMAVYNSYCITCEKNGKALHCGVKKNKCIVNGECINFGATRDCKVCHPSKSQTELSKMPDCRPAQGYDPSDASTIVAASLLIWAVCLIRCIF